MPEIRRRRRARPVGTWIFVRCTSLRAAALRLMGEHGEARRTDAMRELARFYNREARKYAAMTLDTRAEHACDVGVLGGVAMLDPDGVVVAAYYGPGDIRNTSTKFARYALQHRIIEKELNAPLHRRRANRLDLDAYLPAAARTTPPPT